MDKNELANLLALGLADVLKSNALLAALKSLDRFSYAQEKSSFIVYLTNLLAHTFFFKPLIKTIYSI
ncbi:hypothetical protein VIDI103191_19580 [Vibrio diazotrophicus]